MSDDPFSSNPFLVADTQLYKRLCPSVRWSVGRSVGWSVRHARVEKWENAHFRPCPPVRNWWPCIRPCCFLFDITLLPILSLTLQRRGEAVDVRTEPESMLTPKHEFSLTDDLPVENAIVPWDLCRSISTSTSSPTSPTLRS